jgi:hypothetical protein
MGTLDWQQVGDEFHAETRWGTAIIIERRQTPSPWLAAKQLVRFTAQIADASGAVLASSTDGYGPDDFGEFADAEDFLLLRLAEFGSEPPASDPVTGVVGLAEAETAYPGLAFTLDYCARHLPPDADPVHLKRLEIIKSLIYDKIA